MLSASAARNRLEKRLSLKRRRSGSVSDRISWLWTVTLFELVALAAAGCTSCQCSTLRSIRACNFRCSGFQGCGLAKCHD